MIFKSSEPKTWVLYGMGFLMANLLVFFLGCARGKPSEPTRPKPESKIDAITLFMEAVQGGETSAALELLSLAEQERFKGGRGLLSNFQNAKSLKLSTLALRPGVEWGANGLAGIFKELPNNERADIPLIETKGETNPRVEKSGERKTKEILPPLDY